MTQEKMSPLRARMMEDMRIRGMGDKAQKSHIRAIKDFAKFLRRSPDTASSDDLRAYQLHMTDTGGHAVDLQHADRGAAIFFRHHLWARRHEALHAIQDPAEEAAGGVQRAGGFGPADGDTGARAEVPSCAQHFLWRGIARLGSVQPQDQRHRQQPDADPRRSGQGRQGSQSDAVTIPPITD